MNARHGAPAEVAALQAAAAPGAGAGGVTGEASGPAAQGPAGSPLATVWLCAPGLWTPAMPGWARARTALRLDADGSAPTARDGGGASCADAPPGGAGVTGPAASPAPPRRPSPALLPPAERRRVPDTVAAALEAASEAVAASGLAPADLPSVFASSYGDLAGLDALCGQLATPEPLLSPTRFHNAVHNAAAGYWCIATGCRRASQAVAAHDRSFAAGLLEAVTLCLAEDTAVLLVGFDGPTSGPLQAVAPSRGLLAVAVVLSPRPLPASLAGLSVALVPGACDGADADAAGAPGRRSAAARDLAGNASADALPLAEALAAVADGDHNGTSPEAAPARDAPAIAWRQPLTDHLALALRLVPAAPLADPNARPSAATRATPTARPDPA